MRTLIKILEKIGENMGWENMGWVGWMYGVPVYRRPPYYPGLRNDDR